MGLSVATNPGMTTSLDAACRELGLELYELLQSLDPARWRDERAAAIRARLNELARRTRAIRARYAARGDKDAELLAWCDELAQTAERGPVGADSHVDSGSDRHAGDVPTAADWRHLRRRLTDAYDRLSIRERGAAVPRNRPTNYLRNAYHMGNGLMVVLLIQYVLTPLTMIWVAAGFALTAWSVEIFRQCSR